MTTVIVKLDRSAEHRRTSNAFDSYVKEVPAELHEARLTSSDATQAVSTRDTNLL